MGDLTLGLLFDGVVAAVEGVDDGLHLSTTIIDPRTGPQTQMDRVFTVEMQSRNSKKYRDHADGEMRMANTVTVRAAHRVNPKAQAVTQKAAYVDEQNVIIALMTVEASPLCNARVAYDRTKRALTAENEWLLTDILFDLEFDLALGPSVVTGDEVAP